MIKTQKSKMKKLLRSKQSTINNMDNFFSQEKSYLKKIDKCKTRKCLTHNKKRLKEYKKFIKEQDKQCPQKSNDEFYNCTNKFYENSEYKKLFDKWVKCGKKMCGKEIEELIQFRRQNIH
jgi:hypothetical protein